jgi:hypothetical protein
MEDKLKIQCCICKETVCSGGLDPCALVIVANADKEWREQKEQTFYCHMECFRKLVNNDGLMYIMQPDFSTNGENQDECEQAGQGSAAKP